MTALHALDAGIVLERLAAAGYSSGQLGADAMLADIADGIPALAGSGVEGLDWLRRHRPAPPGRLVVCHGDLHAFNLLASEDEITGVLDWELATIGDGALDVARTMLLLSFVPGPIPESRDRWYRCSDEGRLASFEVPMSVSTGSMSSRCVGMRPCTACVC